VADVVDAVNEALRSVHDPCCEERGLSLVDMGLVRSVSVEDGRARVELILTTGWCPFASKILDSVQHRVEDLDGVGEASVEIVWDEAWSMDRLSDEARRQLVFLPTPVTVADRDAFIRDQVTRGTAQ
jgi:metal-sulfur cluster biosynthetic enzyme